MKIKFNGIYEKKTRGCPVCGRSKSEIVFSTTKSFYLPSGRLQTFRVGNEYEVSDEDAHFLLSYKSSKGDVFEVIDG